MIKIINTKSMVDTKSNQQLTLEGLKDYMDSSFKELIQIISDSFQGMEERLNEKFEQIDRRFELIELRFKQIDERFIQIDERFAQFDAKFDQLEKIVSGHTNDLDYLIKQSREITPLYLTKPQDQRL